MLATKAFAFDVKADEAKVGQFSGRASVYGVTDAYGDVVMPGAFTKSIEQLGGEIVVLNQHNPSDPIGKALLEDSDTALLAVGQLVLDLQSAKDAHVRLTNGLVNGISIGYEVLQETYQGNARQLQEIKLWEISLVTFPANQFARVTDVKGLLMQSGINDRLAQLVLEVAPDIKAGRVLSASNRSKIADIVQMLTELLDATDPDKDKSTSAAEAAALKELLTNMRTLRA